MGVGTEEAVNAFLGGVSVVFVDENIFYRGCVFNIRLRRFLRFVRWCDFLFWVNK